MCQQHQCPPGASRSQGTPVSFLQSHFGHPEQCLTKSLGRSSITNLRFHTPKSRNSHRYNAAYDNGAGQLGTGHDVALIDTGPAQRNPALTLTAGVAPGDATALPGLDTVLANLSDGSGNTTDATRYTAQIAWGDGTVTGGTVVADGVGGFDVYSSPHSFVGQGVHEVQVVVTDTETGSQASASVTDAPTPSLALANGGQSVDADGTQVTGDGLLSGDLADIPNLTGITIQLEITVNGNESQYVTTSVNATGSYQYQLADIGLGAVTVQARAMRAGSGGQAPQYGLWSSPLKIRYQPAAMPDVSNLALTDPMIDPSDGSAPMTVDPTFEGQLPEDGENVAGVTIQFEYNGDSTPDGSTTTDPYGRFTFQPQGLQAGNVMIATRASFLDPVSGQSDYSADWSSLTFTYVSVPAVASLDSGLRWNTCRPDMQWTAPSLRAQIRRLRAA